MSDEDYFGPPSEPEEQTVTPPTVEPNNSTHDEEYPVYDEKPAGSRKLLAGVIITAILLVIAATGYILYKQSQDLKTPAHKTNPALRSRP